MKVRCTRCGESFPVEPQHASGEVYATHLTGERNESSVLFSLATLAKPTPTPPKVTESSTLIDLRALVSESAHAPLFAPPVTFAPAEREEQTRPSKHLIVASALALAFVAMVSVTSFVVVRSRPTTTAAARASDAQPSEAASTPSTPAKCCPGESEIACQMRISAGAACGGESPRTSPQAFDRPAAARALGISVSSCKRTDGPTGAGHVKVTFQPSGSVSAVEVEAPYAGTATGACIAQRYRGATVPAFTGGPLAVGKTFAIE